MIKWETIPPKSEDGDWHVHRHELRRGQLIKKILVP